MQAGFGMLLKSMGVDPEQLKSTLTGARDEIMAHVNELKESQKRVEEKLDVLLALAGDPYLSADDKLALLKNGAVGRLDSPKDYTQNPG